MLISDLNYLELIEPSKSLLGGEKTQAFASTTSVIAAVLLDAPPGVSLYTRSTSSSSATVIGNNASAYSSGGSEFGILK